MKTEDGSACNPKASICGSIKVSLWAPHAVLFRSTSRDLSCVTLNAGFAIERLY